MANGCWILLERRSWWATRNTLIRLHWEIFFAGDSAIDCKWAVDGRRRNRQISQTENGCVFLIFRDSFICFIMQRREWNDEQWSDSWLQMSLSRSRWMTPAKFWWLRACHLNFLVSLYISFLASAILQSPRLISRRAIRDNGTVCWLTTERTRYSEESNLTMQIRIWSLLQRTGEGLMIFKSASDLKRAFGFLNNYPLAGAIMLCRQQVCMLFLATLLLLLWRNKII